VIVDEDFPGVDGGAGILNGAASTHCELSTSS